MKWTAEDDLELRRCINSGTKLETIAALLNCTSEDIRARLRERGLDDARLFPEQPPAPSPASKGRPAQNEDDPTL